MELQEMHPGHAFPGLGVDTEIGAKRQKLLEVLGQNDTLFFFLRNG